MKEVKLLDREQAVSILYISLILAAIQETSLKSELAFINCCHISLQCDIYVFEKFDSQTSFI